MIGGCERLVGRGSRRNCNIIEASGIHRLRPLLHLKARRAMAHDRPRLGAPIASIIDRLRFSRLTFCKMPGLSGASPHHDRAFRARTNHQSLITSHSRRMPVPNTNRGLTAYLRLGSGYKNDAPADTRPWCGRTPSPASRESAIGLRLP